MEIFEADTNRQFVAQVLDELKPELPEDSITAEKEPEMIESGLAALSLAESKYELDDSHSLAVFITMAWLYGEDFHLAPEINGILTDESINTRRRMSEVVKTKRV